MPGDNCAIGVENKYLIDTGAVSQTYVAFGIDDKRESCSIKRPDDRLDRPRLTDV
jgi:hypothetical protein